MKYLKFGKLLIIPLTVSCIVGFWFYMWLTPDKTTDIGESRLPDNLIEDEYLGNWCMDYLQETRGSNWTQLDARKCVDRYDGYKNLDGKVVHPFR